MILQVDARKVQVLLLVAQRAPASEAEKIVCGEVAAWLAGLVEGAARDGPPANDVPAGAHDGA